jgi:hypothetical protein
VPLLKTPEVVLFAEEKIGLMREMTKRIREITHTKNIKPANTRA